MKTRITISICIKDMPDGMDFANTENPVTVRLHDPEKNTTFSIVPDTIITMNNMMVTKSGDIGTLYIETDYEGLLPLETLEIAIVTVRMTKPLSEDTVACVDTLKFENDLFRCEVNPKVCLADILCENAQES